MNTFIIDLVSFFISSVFCYKSVIFIVKNGFSALHICNIVFWAMQALPLFIGLVFDINSETHNVTYLAMTDVNTAYIYDLFIVIISVTLNTYANKMYRKFKPENQINLHSLNSITYLIIFLGMFSPIVAVIFAPDISVYLEFAYFYRHNYDVESVARLYHRGTISLCMDISLLCSLFMYMNRKRTGFIYNIDIFLAVASMVWINQKRTMLCYALIGILGLDIVKDNFKNNRRKLIEKVVLFLFVFLIYFYVYSKITEKGSNNAFENDYVYYYSRIAAVKTSIYDYLNGSNILEYPCQTLLFNILIFIPRAVWPNKPAMFCKYFTAYSIGRKSTDFIVWNYQVNIWSEFFANIGILGIIGGFIFTCYIAKFVQNTNNILIRLIGILFLILYYMYGFENVVATLFYIFILVLIIDKIYTNMKGTIQKDGKNQIADNEIDTRQTLS